jgi:hypothetical protein
MAYTSGNTDDVSGHDGNDGLTGADKFGILRPLDSRDNAPVAREAPVPGFHEHMPMDCFEQRLMGQGLRASLSFVAWRALHHRELSFPAGLIHPFPCYTHGMVRLLQGCMSAHFS